MQSRFGHPTTADFIRLLADRCGGQVASFFEQAIAADAGMDYGVASVTPDHGDGSRKEVVVRRYGALTADVRVRFTFAGGRVVDRTISREFTYPWRRFTFELDENGDVYPDLLRVDVDPPGGEFEVDRGVMGTFLIDENLLDNSWQAEPDLRPALYRGVRLLLQTQSRLSFAGLIG